MNEVELVVAHSERATLRVGDVFVKVDGTPGRLEAELAVMEAVPVPTPEVLWHNPPALALARVPGTVLGTLAEPSTASAAAWRATGAMVRRLHDAPLPERTGPSPEELLARLEAECEWLVRSGSLPAHVVVRNRVLAALALTPSTPVFVHGDLQVDHVFVDGDEVTAIIDWSEGAQGDAHADLATLTLGHPERLDQLLAGYGDGVDRKRIRGWWSLRCLLNVRWLVEHGYGPFDDMYEVQLLRRT